MGKYVTRTKSIKYGQAAIFTYTNKRDKSVDTLNSPPPEDRWVTREDGIKMLLDKISCQKLENHRKKDCIPFPGLYNSIPFIIISSHLPRP